MTIEHTEQQARVLALAMTVRRLKKSRKAYMAVQRIWIKEKARLAAMEGAA